MKIKKAHCFFEQSGVFKNAFIHYGIPAVDYDIQNNFGETDNVIDLFIEIEKGYAGKSSIFDCIARDDLIMAFFPCIHFCDAKTLFFKGVSISQKNWSIKKKMDWNIEAALIREKFFVVLMKLFAIVDNLGLRMVLENPYNPSGMTYLENNFMNPTIIDKNRMRRGDFFVKPTGYWFVGCHPSYSETYQKDKEQKVVMKVKSSNQKGLCSQERSMISSDYALNFINDFLLGGSYRKGVLQQVKLF